MKIYKIMKRKGMSSHQEIHDIFGNWLEAHEEVTRLNSLNDEYTYHHEDVTIENE